MAVGPVQILAVAFPTTDRLEGRIADELVSLSDAGTIRIIDALAVLNLGDEIDVIRATDLSDEQRVELGATFGALIGLGAGGVDGFIEGAELGAEVAEAGGLGIVEAIGAEFIEDLPDDSAALLLIIEHTWAIPLRNSILDAGGLLLANRWVGAQDLVALGAAIAASDDQA